MREKPVAFLIHGGPGADHTSYKPTLSPEALLDAIAGFLVMLLDNEILESVGVKQSLFFSK